MLQNAFEDLATEGTLDALRALQATLNTNDVGNTTVTALGAGEVFEGAWTDVSLHGSLFVYFLTDQPGTPNEIQWSSDGLTQNTIIAPTAITQIALPGAYSGLIAINPPFFRDKYYRVVITNGATPQGSLAVIAGLGKFSGAGTLAPIVDALTPLSLATLNRAITAGTNPDGDFENITLQGRHTPNCLNTPLDGGDTFWGQWFEWQGGYVGCIVDLITDVVGTLYIDLTEEISPVDGDMSSVDQSLTFEYGQEEIQEDLFRLFRRTMPVQSRWVRLRYVNGINAQGFVNMDIAFLTTANVVPTAPMGVPPRAEALGLVGQSVLVAESTVEDDVFDHLTMTVTGVHTSLDTNVTGIQEPVVFKSQPELNTGQGDVNGLVDALYPVTAITNRKSVIFTNLSTDTDCFYAHDPVKFDTFDGAALLPRTSVELPLDETGSIYWKLATAGGTSNSQAVDGTGTTAVTAVTNPEFILLSNETHAIMAGATSAATVTGFTTPSTGTAVAEVILQLEARKAAAPLTATVVHVGTQTATGGNVVAVTTPSATAAANSTYLVSVSRRNAAAVVSSMVGMGATWEQVSDATGFGNVSRISVWRNSTPVTTTGAVTALFSTPATNCVISITRFNGVHLATPIENFEPLASTSSNTTYADSITGTELGEAFVAVSHVNQTHTPGNGFTEQADVRTSTLSTAAGLAVSTLNLPATGAQAYSGTLSGAAGWSAVAIALAPEPSIDPVVRVRYSTGVDPTIGVTDLVVTLSNTVDATFEASVFADRSWTLAEINSMTLLVDVVAIGVTPAEIDRVGLYTTETTGAAAARISWAQIGGATP